ERYIMSIYMDVTEQQRLQENLRASEELFSKVFRHNPLAIAISGLEDGRITDINDAFVRLFGFSGEKVIGKTALELGIIAKKEQRDTPATVLKKQGVINDLKVSLS